jgi:hypothetical protein
MWVRTGIVYLRTEANGGVPQIKVMEMRNLLANTENINWKERLCLMEL